MKLHQRYLSIDKKSIEYFSFFTHGAVAWHLYLYDILEYRSNDKEYV
jgi:hypothetical protein